MRSDKVLPPEAQRALSEDKARPKKPPNGPDGREVDGPKGPEPTRYGDWEINGIATDF